MPLQEGENTNKIVIKVAKMLNVSLSSDQISTSHRLQTRLKPKNSEPAASPPIIVRFLSRDVRNQLSANRKLARTANLQEFLLQGAENIYINENLTQSRKKLFWHAKQKAIASNFKFYLSVNGNVYVRKSSDPDSLLIKNIDDISKIKQISSVLHYGYFVRSHIITFPLVGDNECLNHNLSSSIDLVKVTLNPSKKKFSF